MGVCLWTRWLDMGVEILNFSTHDLPAKIPALLSASQGTLFRVFTPLHIKLVKNMDDFTWHLMDKMMYGF
eukprot:2313871-Prorocentrum_lima.AAC.1